MDFFEKLQFWKRRQNNSSKRDNRHYETESQMSEERSSTARTHITECLREICTNVQMLKITNSRLRRQLETSKKIEMELHNKVDKMKKRMKTFMQAVKSEERKHHEDVQRLKKELVAVKDANSKLQKQNEDLEKQLEEVMARTPASSSQLTTSTSGSQGALCLKETNPLNSLQPIRVLCQGAFGNVVLAKKKGPEGSEQLFAVKALTNLNLMDDADRGCVFIEREAMIITSEHPYIVTLHSCFRAKGNLFFVMEYESGGSLAMHLLRERVFSERTVQFYTAEITLALMFLHTHGILHRDLKPANILIGGDGHCKVADFGLSELGIFAGRKTCGVAGTSYYMAPEMVQDIEYGREIDWWALGIMMYVMLTGTLPFYDAQEDILEEKIKCNEVEYPQGVSKAAEGIMRKLLAKDPTQRLGSYRGTEKVQEQPFFEGIDWHALKMKRMEPPRRIEAVEETEGTLTFDDLYKHNNGTAVNSQGEFEGFSHVIHRVKRG